MAIEAAGTVIEAVAATLAGAGVGKRRRLCCALSGGADSVVLLDTLDALRGRFGFALEAAHVHHGLSPAAGEWQAFCAGLCDARGIFLHVFRAEVGRVHPEGLEAAARLARHAALAQVACDWLVLGHHRDDQAETVLFRLLRGAGVRGAAAMTAVEPPDEPGRAGRLRPLLAFGRTAILARARARGLAWVEDASNADLDFARNDLRHRILPAIEARFPAARATLARAASHFRVASGLLDELAEIDAAACGGEDGAFEREALLALSPARLANLLRRTLRRLGGLPPSAAKLAEAMRQLRAVPGPLRFPLGAFACYSYRGRVWLAPAQVAGAQAFSWQPTAGEIAWAGGVLRCRSATGEGVRASALAGAGICRLAPRPAGLPLHLANRPARSFRKLCQEAGIPVWLRGHLPVLEVDGCMAWAGGLGVADGFACAPEDSGWLLEWLPGISPSMPSSVAPVPPRSEPSSC
ncbi:MAG: tRNA lysidine(34) synthetase TilS [Azoarcus sp.]|jgi:tRNA(Ile)-lysidine synthase|nr:tRNA lysidine(34) synthetase TilS [Azoarcus sp.]